MEQVQSSPSHGRLDSITKSKTDNFLKLLFNFKSVGDRKFETFHHSRFIEYKTGRSTMSSPRTDDP